MAQLQRALLPTLVEARLQSINQQRFQPSCLSSGCDCPHLEGVLRRDFLQEHMLFVEESADPAIAHPDIQRLSIAEGEIDDRPGPRKDIRAHELNTCGRR